jgi:hypothetical protein
MIHYQTSFRPSIDGFAFGNAWHLNAAERADIQNVVAGALPTVVAALTPLLLTVSPVVLTALGPALIIAGPFLPLVLPLAIKAAVKAIGNEVADEAKTWCGGMAFAAADYFQLNWALPRGLAADDEPDSQNPAGLTAGGVVLREYIFSRLIDCQLANLETSLLWHFMKAFMSSYGDAYVRDQTRNQVVAVGAKIAAGTPCPIYLLHPGLDPSADHVVVAIGFQELDINVWQIDVYDVDLPTDVHTLHIDATHSPLVITEPTRDDKPTWTGLFLADYTPHRPPPAIVATSDIIVNPPGFCGVGRPVTASFTALNQGYHATLAAELGVGYPDSNWAFFKDTGQKHVALEGQPLLMSAPAPGVFPYPGLVQLVPKVLLWPDPKDMDPNPNPSVKLLPHPNGDAVDPIPYRITPRIPIHGHDRARDTCSPLFIAAAELWLTADVTAVQGIGIAAYDWVISGAIDQTFHDVSPYIPSLPPANTEFHIDLTVHLKDGTAAYGALDAVMLDPAAGARMIGFCRFLHQIEHRFRPQRIPTGDPVDTVQWLQGDGAREAMDIPRLIDQVRSFMNELER